MLTRGLFAPLLLASLLAGGGCAGSAPPIVNGPAYPDRAQSGVIDVQVVRHSTTITMTNTSARAFKDARLWANQWYSRDLPSWEPGQTLTLGLEEFKDRYGQPMKAGGFWAADNPERLALMQLQQGDELTGLIVIGQAE
ncbi:MAG: hypothetical protein K2Q09_11630 [Phycisphaerales bacterium]|nr:hypothetical protein [Phycisphaerales bacterium]